jgi:hypothetical protein
MCQACGDPAHDPDGAGDDGVEDGPGEDELDEDEHECPWCGWPCRCPTGADEPGPGEPLDCQHRCEDEPDDEEA